jgi:hypothetical protein
MEKIFKFNDVARLFSKIKGFFLCYSDMKVNPVVSKWNVNILKLDRMARHKDALLFTEFWKNVNEFLLSDK